MTPTIQKVRRRWAAGHYKKVTRRRWWRTPGATARPTRTGPRGADPRRRAVRHAVWPGPLREIAEAARFDRGFRGARATCAGRESRYAPRASSSRVLAGAAAGDAGSSWSHGSPLRAPARQRQDTRVVRCLSENTIQELVAGALPGDARRGPTSTSRRARCAARWWSSWRATVTWREIRARDRNPEDPDRWSSLPAPIHGRGER